MIINYKTRLSYAPKGDSCYREVFVAVEVIGGVIKLNYFK